VNIKHKLIQPWWCKPCPPSRWCSTADTSWIHEQRRALINLTWIKRNHLLYHQYSQQTKAGELGTGSEVFFIEFGNGSIKMQGCRKTNKTIILTQTLNKDEQTSKSLGIWEDQNKHYRMKALSFLINPAYKVISPISPNCCPPSLPPSWKCAWSKLASRTCGPALPTKQSSTSPDSLLQSSNLVNWGSPWEGEGQSPDEGVDVWGAELPMCGGVAARWLAGWVGALDAGLGMPRSYRGLGRLWLLLDAGLGMPRSYRGLGLLWLFRGLNWYS